MGLNDKFIKIVKIWDCCILPVKHLRSSTHFWNKKKNEYSNKNVEIPNLREHLSQEINFSSVRKATLKKEPKLFQKRSFKNSDISRENLDLPAFSPPYLQPMNSYLQILTMLGRGCLDCFGSFFFW